MKLLLTMLYAILFLIACNDGDENANERLKERIGQETEQSLEQERQAREKLVKEMEADLKVRQRLYQSVKGQYFGKYRINSENYTIAAEFVPTVIPFDPKYRIRTPEEVNSDIQRLSLDVKIVIRDVATKALLVSCDAKSVPMDLTEGSMAWLSESASCSNAFVIYVSNENSDPARRSVDELRVESRELASKVLSSNQESKVKQLALRMKPSASSESFMFKLNKGDL